MKYIEKNGVPTSVQDSVEWGRWFEKADRSLAQTNIGKAHVSTVFLGLDHNFSSKGPPILYETMIFGGKHDEYQKRYSTRKEAFLGHERAVQLVRKTEKETKL